MLVGAELGVELVLECSGQYLTREKLEPFFAGGAKRVVVSAACKGDILNVVYGCNHDEYDPEDPKHHIVTAASCTTNCIAPPIKVIKENIGIVHGSITTMHCITNTQPLVDAIVGKKADPRRARSGMNNLAPTSTNSATAITMIYPDLKGKLNGMAVRIPLMYASLTDLTLELARPTTSEEVNGFLEAASKSAPLAGILGFETKPLVSSDYRCGMRVLICPSWPTTLCRARLPLCWALVCACLRPKHLRLVLTWAWLCLPACLPCVCCSARIRVQELWMRCRQWS